MKTTAQRPSRPTTPAPWAQAPARSEACTRLHRDGLARTITTNFHNPGGGRFLHYGLDRTLTIREAARIQGFRDDFGFTGRPGVQERRVGNAFPPLWAEAIAAHVTAELHDFLAA